MKALKKKQYCQSMMERLIIIILHGVRAFVVSFLSVLRIASPSEKDNINRCMLLINYITYPCSMRKYR